MTRALITGLGVVCAAGSDLRAFTKALREGASGIVRRDPAADASGPGWPDRAAPLAGFVVADAVHDCAGLPASLRRAACRAVGRSPLSVQVATVAALQAWQQAELHEVPVPAERIGVVVAGSNLTGGYAWRLRPRFERDPAYLPPSFALHYQDTDHVATLSQILGIHGEGFTVGGASASGNIGIIQGSRLIECGAVDACLVVGALTELSPMELRGFCNLGAAAASDRPYGAPFDVDHRGFVPGEGSAALILESAESAGRRRVPAATELCGYAQGLDGNRLADPSTLGETRAMTVALARAAVTGAAVDYVNTHGTGAPRGDRAELDALAEVFGAERPWINATKALTGHCLSAAGVVEAVATVVQLAAGFVHPTVDLRTPIESSVRFVGPAARDVPLRYALSNSFGFGGFNTSIVLGMPAG